MLSILIPTKNRAKYSDLVCYNINIQTYKSIKEIVVMDDGNEPLDLSSCKYPVRYIKKTNDMTIGHKRNQLIKECNTKYYAFMDDDDFYFPEYITYSMNVLKSNKKYKIVGSTEMNFYFKDKIAYGAMSCSTIYLPHEATFVGETKFLKQNKFKTTQTGEGDFLKDLTSFLGLTNIDACMVCCVHDSNTVSKERWFVPQKSEYYKAKLSKKIENHLELI